MNRFIYFLTLSLIFSCSSSKVVTEKYIAPKDDVELMKLFELMQGSFNSAEQALRDTNYYDITLHMYPIWHYSDDLYLYVEQSLTSMQDKPYRQRVYKVSRENENTFRSDIYKIENDSIWIGQWKTPTNFNKIAEGDLILRNGCEVMLTKDADNKYVGSTGNKTCESSMRGASYATSEVEIFDEKIISWDRGFDADGNHKWGAENGGYVFKKLQRAYRMEKPVK